MGRFDRERLSKEELIELVPRLQRPAKTSRTSSTPPATDREERRDKAKPGGANPVSAKPGHEGHSRAMSEDFDSVVDHHPDACPCRRAALPADLPSETFSEHAVVHQAAPTRGAVVVRTIMDGIAPTSGSTNPTNTGYSEISRLDQRSVSRPLYRYGKPYGYEFFIMFF